MVVNEYYMSSSSQHVKNNILLFIDKFLWLNKLQMGTCRKQKKVHAVCHDLPMKQGQSMMDFEGCKKFFNFFKVPNNP